MMSAPADVDVTGSDQDFGNNLDEQDDSEDFEESSDGEESQSEPKRPGARLVQFYKDPSPESGINESSEIEPVVWHTSITCGVVYTLMVLRVEDALI